jgi:hypothetical protein
MSEFGLGTLIKLAYRGIAGFVAFILLFSLGVTGGALSFAGGLVTALSWLPLAYPELATYVFVIDGEGIFVNNPELATATLFIAGLLLLAVGFLLLALTYFLGKAALAVDKELSHMVDKTFTSSGNDRISNLERLASLHERGILTDKEFEREKQYLLRTTSDDY